MTKRPFQVCGGSFIFLSLTFWWFGNEGNWYGRIDEALLEREREREETRREPAPTRQRKRSRKMAGAYQRGAGGSQSVSGY